MARQALDAGEVGKVRLTPERLTPSGGHVARKAGDRRKADRWRASVRVGTGLRDASGKPVARLVQRYGGTEQEARERLEEALQEGAGGVRGDISGETTVVELAAAWLDHLERADEVSSGTLRIYRLVTNRYVLPTESGKVEDGRGYLAGLKLRQVTPAKVEQALRAVLDAEPGKGAGTVKTLRSVFRGMFELATRHEAMDANPVRAAGAIRPKRSAKSEPRQHLEPAEVVALVEAADADDAGRRVSRDLGDLVAFLAGTGVRIGEALAATWDDVDLTNGTVRVGGKTVVRVAGVGLKVEDHGRTKRGDRTVALPASLVKRLRARKVGQTRAALAAPRPRKGTADPLRLVFPAHSRTDRSVATLRDPSNVAHHMRDLLDAAGFADVRGSHIFRHTVATQLERDGASAREVANVLGHKNVKTTTDVYMSRDVVSERTTTALDWSARAAEGAHR